MNFIIVPSADGRDIMVNLDNVTAVTTDGDNIRIWTTAAVDDCFVVKATMEEFENLILAKSIN